MAEQRMVRVVAEPLTADAWAPFGWLPVDEGDPADRTHELAFEWADPHLNVIAHTHEEVEHTPAGSVCTGFYRHATHTQALMPLDVDAVLAVAEPGTDLSRPGSLERVRAFLVHPLDVLVLHRSTWHWGPFPLGTEPVRLLNLQGRRYAEDNEHVDLAATTGAVLEVVTG